MYLAEVESVLRMAVVAYQVEYGEGSSLVDPANVVFELFPPGAYDSHARESLAGWRVAMGEDGSRIESADGDKLASALDAFAAKVRERANVVHVLLDGEKGGA